MKLPDFADGVIVTFIQNFASSQYTMKSIAGHHSIEWWIRRWPQLLCIYPDPYNRQVSSLQKILFSINLNIDNLVFFTALDIITSSCVETND